VPCIFYTSLRCRAAESAQQQSHFHPETKLFVMAPGKKTTPQPSARKSSFGVCNLAGFSQLKYEVKIKFKFLSFS